MQALDLPEAVFLHVVVLVRAAAPLGRIGLGCGADLGNEAPPTLRRLAIVRDVDDGLQLQIVEQLSAYQAFGRGARYVVLNALLADEHAAATELQRAFVGEEIGRVFPLRLVDVEAVRALQGLDRVFVFESRDGFLDIRHERTCAGRQPAEIDLRVHDGRAACDRILVVIDRVVDVGEAFIHDGRRPIRRNLRARLRRRS